MKVPGFIRTASVETDGTILGRPSLEQGASTKTLSNVLGGNLRPSYLVMATLATPRRSQFDRGGAILAIEGSLAIRSSRFFIILEI